MRCPKYLNYPYPKDFLKAEVRTGAFGEHEVTEDTKALWLCLLELLQEFSRICKENNLKWRVEGGTLLGAIRHNGFIPWDDDVDICMFRDDYEKLLELDRAGAIKFPYTLDYAAKCPGFGRSYAKLKLEGTTRVAMLHETEPKWGVTPAVHIDISPTDYLPSEHADTEFFDFMNDLTAFTTHRLFKFYPERVHLYETTPEEVQKVFALFDKAIQKYNTLENPEWCETLSLPVTYVREIQGSKEPWCSSTRRKVSWVAETIDWPFEYITVPVPVGYKESLDMQYPGWDTEYRKFSHHPCFINVYKGYEEFYPKLMSEKKKKAKERYERIHRSLV